MAIQQNLQAIIDSRFYVPPGAVDIRQADSTNSENSYNANTVAVDNNAPILASPAAKVPMPPTSFQVVSQHVKIASDGTATVDVTLEFQDIAGVDHIDVRISRTA